MRGTLGLIGDAFMRPTTYLVDFPIMVGVRAYELVNETSLTIGDYEGLTEPALDPYIAVFEEGDELAHPDWRLARDLVLIRMVEQLYGQGWLRNNVDVIPETAEEEEAESD